MARSKKTIRITNPPRCYRFQPTFACVLTPPAPRLSPLFASGLRGSPSAPQLTKLIMTTIIAIDFISERPSSGQLARGLARALFHQNLSEMTLNFQPPTRQIHPPLCHHAPLASVPVSNQAGRILVFPPMPQVIRLRGVHPKWQP